MRAISGTIKTYISFDIAPKIFHRALVIPKSLVSWSPATTNNPFNLNVSKMISVNKLPSFVFHYFTSNI